MAKKKNNEEIESELNNALNPSVPQPGQTTPGQQQIIDNTNAAIASAQQSGNAFVQNMEQTQQKLEEEQSNAMQTIGQSNASVETSFADMLLKQKEDLDRQQKENDILTKAEDSRNTWAAATEVASAMANLVGVGKMGASNQQPHQYSQTWMREADKAREARKARIDNIKERQRNAEAQLAQLKAGNANSMAQMKLNIAGQNAQAANTIASANKDTADKIAGLQYQGANQATQMGVNERQANRSFNQQEQARQDNLDYRTKAEENDMLAKGFIADATAPGGYRFDESLARRIQQTKGTGTGGNGTSKGISVTFAKSEGGEQETMVINPQSMVNTIMANINDINDLTDEDKVALQAILNDPSKSADQKAKEMQGYIGHSRMGRQLLRASASGYSEATGSYEDPTGGAASFFGM